MTIHKPTDGRAYRDAAGLAAVQLALALDEPLAIENAACRDEDSRRRGAAAQPVDGRTAERALLEDRLDPRDRRTMAQFRDSDAGDSFAEIDEIWRRAVRMMNVEGGSTLAAMDAMDEDAREEAGINGYATQIAYIEGHARDLLAAVRAAKSGDATGEVLRQIQRAGDLLEEFEGWGYPLADDGADATRYDLPALYDPDRPTPEMDPADVFPAPARTVSLPIDRSMRPGEFVTPETAAARIATWKAEARGMGEAGGHADKVILSLFDYTGAWSQPWVEAGFTVLRFDVKTGDDILRDPIENRIREHVQEGRTVYGVLSACPCTTFTVSGARWWAPLHDVESPEALRKVFGEWAAASGAKSARQYNAMLAERTKELVRIANPSGFHVLENPIGRIETEARLPPPTLRFDPFQYGDPYTKRTQLWGAFNPRLPTAPVVPVEGTKIQSQLRGTDAKQKEERSVTPEGFAYAFFVANRPQGGGDGGIARRDSRRTSELRAHRQAEKCA